MLFKLFTTNGMQHVFDKIQDFEACEFSFLAEKLEDLDKEIEVFRDIIVDAYCGNGYDFDSDESSGIAYLNLEQTDESYHKSDDFDEDDKMKRLFCFVRFLRGGKHWILAVERYAYLCNDEGKTISVIEPNPNRVYGVDYSPDLSKIKLPISDKKEVENRKD